jgi:hypothetical protein
MGRARPQSDPPHGGPAHRGGVGGAANIGSCLAPTVSRGGRDAGCGRWSLRAWRPRQRGSARPGRARRRPQGSRSASARQWGCALLTRLSRGKPAMACCTLYFHSPALMKACSAVGPRGGVGERPKICYLLHGLGRPHELGAAHEYRALRRQLPLIVVMRTGVGASTRCGVEACPRATSSRTPSGSWTAPPRRSGCVGAV